MELRQRPFHSTWNGDSNSLFKNTMANHRKRAISCLKTLKNAIFEQAWTNACSGRIH